TGTVAVDVIRTGAGNDRLVGGAGNDVLSGGAGSDTYVFNRGDGFDLIDDQAEPDKTNIIVFGPGIDPRDIRLAYAGHEGGLALKIGAEGLLLTGFNGFNAGSPPSIDTFQFADGTTLSFDD